MASHLGSTSSGWLSHIALVSFALLLLLLRSTTVTAEDCDNGRGECTLPSDCQPFLIAVDIMRFKFCNLAQRTICCPKKKPPAVYNEDLSQPGKRACKQYREELFKDCGVQPFIIGGKKADPKEFPHMAYLGVLDEATGQFHGHCGGTLITERFVLSAAHCFLDDPTTHVRLGELDWSTDRDDARPKDYAIARTITPPAYDESAKYNDIILVELNETAILSPYVVPACLTLRSGDEYNDFIAAGWGSTKTEAKSKHLLKVYLERFAYDECYRRFDVGGGLHRGVVNRTQICAGSHTTESDTCVGDSGGPLFRQHPKYPCMYELIGVTSLGGACGKRLPGLYTRVGLYSEWIEQIVWNSAIHL